MSDGSVEQGTTSKPPEIRRKANDASEARLLIRQMHKRVPAWKLTLCSEALNARPIDHVRIAEVTEIQFAKDELVDVAVQCLVDIARESESVTNSVGVASPARAAASQDEKGHTNRQMVNVPQHRVHQKSTSSPAVLTQDATASLEKSTSEQSDKSDDWVTRFLKKGHDLLWPNTLAPSTCPTLLNGLKMDTSDHLIDNLMEWERKFESADLEKHTKLLLNYLCVIILLRLQLGF